MMIQLDRDVLRAAVSKSRIALSSTLGNDQTVFLKFVVMGQEMTIYATDLIFSSKVSMPLDESYEHKEFTAQGLNFDGLLPYLTASDVAIDPRVDDLYVAVKSGNSDVSVRSIPLAQYKDISDKFKEIEWDYSIDREELIRAFTYVLNFAAEKESHPELSQITIRNSTVFGGDVYQVGIYQSPAIDPEINLSIAVPLVPRLLKAIKMMKDSKVSFSVKDKVLVVGEDGFHVSFRVPSADPAELNKLLDQPFPTEVEVDRQYLDNAVRLVSTTLDTGSEQRIEFNFPKAKTEEQQNMHVQVEVNGRKSEDQLPVRYDQEGDKPVGFKLNYKDMLGVIAAIKLNVIGIAYHPEMKMVRFYEVDEESGQSTYSFLATLQRTEDAKPKSEKSADDGETADATAEVADPAPKAD